jgi:hypothetical protein
MEEIYVVYGEDESGEAPWIRFPVKYFRKYEDAQAYSLTLKNSYVTKVKLN